MARIRTVKPELWTDTAFVECSPNARLLFVAGLNFASDYGVLPDNPLQLKMQCFPGDSVDVQPLIDELLAVNLWERVYAPDGTIVLLVRTFSQHQRVDRPNKSRWGDPAEWDEIRRVVDDDSSNDQRTLVLEGRKERKDTVDAERSTKGGVPDSFDDWWKQYPRKRGKQAAVTAYAKALKLTDAQTLYDAVANWVKIEWRDRPLDKIPHPSTWLNERRWEDELEDNRKKPGQGEVDGGGYVGGDW